MLEGLFDQWAITCATQESYELASVIADLLEEEGKTWAVLWRAIAFYKKKYGYDTRWVWRWHVYTKKDSVYDFFRFRVGLMTGTFDVEYNYCNYCSFDHYDGKVIHKQEIKKYVNCDLEENKEWIIAEFYAFCEKLLKSKSKVRPHLFSYGYSRKRPLAKVLPRG